MNKSCSRCGTPHNSTYGSFCEDCWADGLRSEIRSVNTTISPSHKQPAPVRKPAPRRADIRCSHCLSRGACVATCRRFAGVRS